MEDCTPVCRWFRKGLFYVSGGTADGCLPLDPNCHPSCMVYDAARCRYCRPGCNNGNNVEIQIRWGWGRRKGERNLDNSGITFSYFSMKTYVVTPHLN